MNLWRVVVTDSESLTGVAPVCPAATTNAHFIPDLNKWDATGVYDCCPGPHIECWSESAASAICSALTQAEAEVCS